MAIPAIVVCIGPEAWLRDDAIRHLAAQCLAPGAEALDSVTFQAAEVSPEAIVAAARTPPFRSPRRLVVVRGPLRVDEVSLAWLLAYARQPAATACLVVELAKEPAESLPVARLVRCQPLQAGQAAAWVRERLRTQHRKVLTPAAAQALVARAGTELAALASWLEQLALYVGSRGQVTVEDVTALVGWSVEERAFAVVDAVIRQDRITAIRLTRQMLEEGDVPPEALLGALGKHLRRLWQMRRLSRARVTAALKALVETDRRLKTGRLDGASLVEPCVWALAGPVRPVGSNGAGRGELMQTPA